MWRIEFPKEVKEWAVRLVLENQRQSPSQWSTISSVAEKKLVVRASRKQGRFIQEGGHFGFAIKGDKVALQ